MTIRQETTRANLSINTEIGNGHNIARALSPLRLGLTNLRDGWEGSKHSGEARSRGRRGRSKEGNTFRRWKGRLRRKQTRRVPKLGHWKCR